MSEKTVRISRFLDTNGDGTGTKNAIGDYSSAAEEFYIAPPAGKVYAIHRMIVSVEDVGAFDANKYGNNITVANGIRVDVKSAAGVVFTITDTEDLVKTNSGWGHYCYDVNHLTFGSGNEELLVRWTFDKKGGPIILSGDDGEYLAVTLNDNFSGLVNHRFLIQAEDRTTTY